MPFSVIFVSGGDFMKLFHISDLHLGKRVYEFSMMEDQKYILQQILDLAKEHQPDGILISGDVYDKSIPPVEAVALLDDFLTALKKQKIAVYLISGNHDSAGRLDFGSRILEQQQIYICGAFDGKLYHVCQTDTFGEVHFYLLPFLKPAMLSPYRAEETSLSYMDAVRWVLEHAEIDTTKRNVLLAHQFVTWHGAAEQSDSETKSLGGVDEMDASLFFDFDYVALGHLHSPQRIGRDFIRYGGSPLRYSFSEIRQKKSVTMVELQEKGNIQINFLPLQPLHGMLEVKGTLAQLLEAAESEGGSDDYIRAVLTDTSAVLDPVGKLRRYYPNMMTVERHVQREGEAHTLTLQKRPQEFSGMDLFAQFYEKQNDHPLTEEQKNLAQEIWKQCESGGEIS